MSDDKLTHKDLKLILESSPDLYLILDPELNIVEVSDKYCEATMVKREDILGKGMFEVFPDNPADPMATGVTNLMASLKRALSNKKPDTMAVQKYDIRRPSEQGQMFEERYWSPINTPVLDDKNDVKYIIHRVKDVTEFIKLKASEVEQFQISERLLADNEIMGLEIYHRAIEIQEMNDQLRIATEKAEELARQADADNRAKSVFLATMSHEIRTSLNGVIGMTELLLDTPLAAQQLEYAETIRISGEALLSVINNVLDYSKIESGSFQLDTVEFELQYILDQTLEIIIGQAYRKRIELGAFIETDVPEWFYGDPARLRQILNNLICNAVKFTKQGEVSIWVKVLNKADDHINLLFEITDTGLGMNKETIDKLFRPFSQADAKTAIKYGGTGLGLCISKQLIEMMEGTIHVQSQLGKGSTFSFTLKLKESTHTPIPHFKVLPEFKESKILCVDDSEINRKIIKRLLTNWGIQCDVIDSPSKAITTLIAAVDSGTPYTVVLIDDCMTQTSGIDLVKIIRQFKEIAKIPIVMLLSLGFPFNESKYTELDVRHFISKPVHPKRLYTYLMNIILKKETPSPKRSSANVAKKMQAHILLAEDNFINQQICLGILGKFGLTADIVASGLEAVHAYKNDSYDLILMDCQMPEMDGYDATKEIRKIEEETDSHVPIIAMTAHALKGDREKCIQAGMDDYMSKPIVVKKLGEILNKWLLERENKI